MRKLFSNKWDLLHRKAQSYKVSNKNDLFAHGRISIKLFVVYLHIINECSSYKFHPYSILTGHTKVESVAYQVLMRCHIAKPKNILVKSNLDLNFCLRPYMNSLLYIKIVGTSIETGKNLLDPISKPLNSIIVPIQMLHINYSNEFLLQFQHSYHSIIKLKTCLKSYQKFIFA